MFFEIGVVFKSFEATKRSSGIISIGGFQRYRDIWLSGVEVDNMKKNRRVVLGVLFFGLILLFVKPKSVRKMKTKWNEKRHSLGKVNDQVY